MEITYSRMVNYSMTLDAKHRRALAQHLGITVRQLIKLAEEEQLHAEYGHDVATWMDDNPELAEITGEEDIEIEDITS